MAQKTATDKQKFTAEKKKNGKTKLAKIQTGKYSVHEERQRVKRIKKRVWFAVFIGLVVLFFVFGFVAPLIWPGTWVATIAKESIADVINIVNLVQNNQHTIFNSISVLFIGVVIIWLLILLVSLFGKGNNRRKTVFGLIASFIKYIGAVVILMTLLNLWGVDTVTLVAGLGILTLIVGLGAQSLISDILAGLFIVFENNFCIGDIVTVEGFRGAVCEIGIRTTRIKSHLGDLKIINNSHIRMLINMSRHSSFAICEVTISYSENLERVEKIITANLEKIAKKLPAIIETPGYLGAAEFTSRGVLLKIKARCVEADRLQLIRDFNKEIKLLLDKNKIKIAVEQVEVKAPKR